MLRTRINRLLVALDHGAITPTDFADYVRVVMRSDSVVAEVDPEALSRARRSVRHARLCPGCGPYDTCPDCAGDSPLFPLIRGATGDLIAFTQRGTPDA